MKLKLTMGIVLMGMLLPLKAQTTQNTDTEEKKEIKFNFNKDGSHWVKFTVLNQVWLRFNESNPGTVADNVLKPYTFDIGIRRLRLQVMAQPHDRFYVYVQFGMNNFSPQSPRKMGDFFHDAIVEYTPIKKYLSIGAGLTGWTGHSRYSAPSVGAIMGIDAPLYQQSTNDVSDQFVRKLSVYIKGKIWKFDYRFVLSDPFTITSSSLFNPNISQNANFTNINRNLQPSGYLQFEFFDKESNQGPYAVGTYHGKKKVLNIGTGFVYQKDATWYTTNGADTNFHDMFLFGADVFYDTYFGKDKQWCLSLYGAYNYFNYGPGYLRNVGAMNPGVSVAPGTATVNGTGSGYPMIGTGHTGYIQTGVMLSKKWFGNKTFTMMPYFASQLSKWDRLNDLMVNFDAGLNFLFDGHRYKMTINYSNRPVFNNTSMQVIQRNSLVNMQFQINI